MKITQGKNVLHNEGVATFMRDGDGYVFTTVYDLDIHHQAQLSKDRTNLFGNINFMITEETGRQIVKWLSERKPVPEKERVPVDVNG